jgi:hypothetical protein
VISAIRCFGIRLARPQDVRTGELDYQYDHFRRELMYKDLSFHGGPAPGEPLPDFNLLTTEGDRRLKSEFHGRPLLLTMGSITCPMTKDSALALGRLHEEFGDRLAFLTLYVREAHPGERYPQPHFFQEKMAHARAYRERDAIPWPVVVDAVEGYFHQALDPKPNALYLVDAEGRVVFRALWSNEYARPRQAIEQLIAQPAAILGDAEFQPVALMRGVGVMHEVLAEAGPQAERDVLRELPPLFALERLAGTFRTLSPLARFIAAMAVTVGAAAAVGALARRAVRHT